MKKQVLILKDAAPLLLTTALIEYLRFFASDDGATARAKRLDLAAFDSFLFDRIKYRNIFLSEVTQSDVKAFRDALMEKEAPRTVIRRLATVRHFFNYWRSKYPEFVNPARGVEPPLIMEGEPRISDGRSKS